MFASIRDAGNVERLGGYRTIELRGGPDPSAREPICPATSGR